MCRAAVNLLFYVSSGAGGYTLRHVMNRVTSRMDMQGDGCGLDV